MHYRRHYEDLQPYLKKGKVLVIYGPRRVGKTTLIQTFLNTTALVYKLDSGDNIKTQQILGSQDFSLIADYCEGYQMLVIDEAQQIPNIGRGLKIIVDQHPDLYVIATGSSSFDLSQQIGEPLTGRKRTLTLYPLSQIELRQHFNLHELSENLENFLLFGGYPEIHTLKTSKEKIECLDELAHAYLLKDILSLERIKSSQTVMNLLKMLAFQIGNEVSFSELANNLAINVKTVQRYLDLLEKSFVIIPLTAYSRNLRSELKRKQKYFFWDLGIRNALISQFNPLSLRNDQGALWENFVVTERLKKHAYKGLISTSYFWRNYRQQEIDLIEEQGGTLLAFECKWKHHSKSILPPAEWRATYPESAFSVVTPDNYLKFVL